MKADADFELERACGAVPVCGIDEVGRGPWAGPLVAAAVILSGPVEGVRDSKTLSAKRRAALAERIEAEHDIGLGIVDVAELDRIGLTRANDLAMLRAARALPRRPAFALVDGRRLTPGLPCPGLAVIGGDARSASIAAASIVAKVHRDTLMARLDVAHPGYGWATNAGYGTRAHATALQTLGVTPQHRRSFRPVREILTQQQKTES